MGRYLVTRLAWSVLIIVASSMVVFLILRVLPSDPVLARLGATTGVDPGVIERLRREAGLDLGHAGGVEMVEGDAVFRAGLPAGL